MKLYEEVDMIEDAINGILYGEEEIDIVALDNLMQAKQDTIERGMESLCKIRARKQGEISAAQAEIDRLRLKVVTEEQALTRLEQYMMSILARSGQKKLTAGTFTVGTRLSNSVWVDPNFNVPEFMRTNTTTAPDKIAIRDALKAGQSIPGACITTKENLSVK